MFNLVVRLLQKGDKPPVEYRATVQMPRVRWKKVNLPGGGVVWRLPEQGDTQPLPTVDKAIVPLVRACPRCKRLKSLGDSYCDSCGWKLGQPWNHPLDLEGRI